MAWCTYAFANALLHSLLRRHYFATCQSSWWAVFLLEPGPYCAVVRRALTVLQWSPLAVTGAVWPAALTGNFGPQRG